MAHEEFTDECMADVGRALMQQIKAYADAGWHSMDCPSEIVGDLHCEREEARAEISRLQKENAELRETLNGEPHH